MKETAVYKLPWRGVGEWEREVRGGGEVAG
jgi:hypothetical protein